MSAGALLANNAVMLGGGAAASPKTTTTGTGVVTALGVNTNAAGGVALVNTVPTSGNLREVVRDRTCRRRNGQRRRNDYRRHDADDRVHRWADDV